MTMTELDKDLAAMEAEPDNDTARLQFYERLADSELFILLACEPEGEDDITPEVIESDGTQYVLVFDREDRLSAFAERVASYAAVSGRGLAEMLDGQGIGLAVNLGAPSSILIPPTAVSWLVGILAKAPQAAEARPIEFLPPDSLPEALVRGLERKLASAGGFAAAAYLVGVTYDTGAKGHLLVFAGAAEGAEAALASAVSEALVFSGIEAGMLDVTFVPSEAPIVDSLTRVGLRFDFPKPEPATHVPGANPGMNPDRPPRLR